MKEKLRHRLLPTIHPEIKLSPFQWRYFQLIEASPQNLVNSIKELMKNNPFIQLSNSLSDFDEIDTILDLPNLKDELYYQLHTQKEKYNEEICNYIIESLNENGFLEETLEVLCSYLPHHQETIEKSIKLIQSFTPIGVACRNSMEAIKKQLMERNQLYCIFLMETYAIEIINQDIKKIARLENKEVSEIEEHLKAIKQCNPFPCSAYSNFKSQQIIPEFEVIVEDNALVIYPIHQLKIEIVDKELLKKQKQISQYLKEANYFVEALNQRNATMLMIVNEIISIQKEYFLCHTSLKVCTITHIAKTLGLDISTVSRAIKDQYILFLDKTIPLRSLIISKAKEGISKDEIQKQIIEILKENDYKLSDRLIAETITKQGIPVSRQLITKYRKNMHISNSYKRKK